MSNAEVFPPWSIDLITIIMEIIIINNCSYTTGITVVVYCNVTSVHIVRELVLIVLVKLIL